MSVFEHFLTAKLWYTQAAQALCTPVSKSLIERLIRHADGYLLHDFTDINEQLRAKCLSNDIKIDDSTDQIQALLEQATPLDVFSVDNQNEIDEPKKTKNEQIQMQIETLLNECLQSTSLLKGHLLELYVRRNEHYALSSGLQMLNMPEKSLLFEEVQKILDFLKELSLTDYTVYKKLLQLFDLQLVWRDKISDLLRTPVPELDEITFNLRSYRNRERGGIALVQARHCELKRIFAQKPSCEQLIELLNEDLGQKVFNNQQYIERLHQKYLWVTDFNNLTQILQQMQCQAKPVKQLYQSLLLLACQPIKAASVDTLISIWQQSCVWKAHAKSFITLHSNTTTDASPDQVAASIQHQQFGSEIEKKDACVTSTGFTRQKQATITSWQGLSKDYSRAPPSLINSYKGMNSNAQAELGQFVEVCDSHWHRLIKSVRKQIKSFNVQAADESAQQIADWDSSSSQEAMDLDEAVEQDKRLLNDLRELEDQPMVSDQLSKFIQKSQLLQAEDDYDQEKKSPKNQTDELPQSFESDAPTKGKEQSAPASRLMFTERDIDQLLSQVIGDNQANQAQSFFNSDQVRFVYDKRLCEKVWQRADFLRKLKQRVGHVAQECHQIEEINEYIKTCQAQSNFDLSHEAQVAKEKLCLMQDALKIGQINNQEDQGLVASEVYSRVQQLKERDVDKIRIPADLEMMLQAKVQISEKLRRDFYDILEKGRGADSFNKEQMQNLRNIVQKATKDHGLQMEQENKIVDNLKNSEAWFDSTFRSLKNLCGPALNQIDFKDFQQLHSIFQSSKDCELLLKKHVHTKPQMENLVGAAKNLYMSLLRAKWLFDVKNLMDKATGTKDLAQLLCLYNRANELDIDFSKAQTGSFQNEFVLAEESVTQTGSVEENESLILREFNRLGQVSNKFDALFGTHQRIIQTLERHEREEKMDKLKETVQALQSDLLPQPTAQDLPSAAENSLIKREFSSRVFAISTTNELEILKKVRDYIHLNENYLDYMLNNESATKSEALAVEEQLKTEIEVPEEAPPAQIEEESKAVTQIQTMGPQETNIGGDSALKDSLPKKQKISYQKAMELQRQAREQQIPDDIPVLKRLNQSVQRFEKFRRLCTDYYRFREKMKQKGADLLTSSSALIGQKQNERAKVPIQTINNINQANADNKFNLVFLKRLLLESEEIEIDIPKEYFNKEKIVEELALFQSWKIRTDQTLIHLEKELTHTTRLNSDSNSDTNEDVVSKETRQLFENAKQQIKDLPVFDSETFMRIQAFEWLLMATSLIQGHQKFNQGVSVNKTSTSNAQDRASSANLSLHKQRIFSLTFWEQLFRQHENYLKVLPMLEDHPIIQNVLWEIDRAKTVVEFVKQTKKTIQSNQGKWISYRFDNYVAFKDKKDVQQIRRLLAQAQSTRVDISEETQVLREWLRTFERYMQMVEQGTLYTGNTYEKVKQIHKNVYLSPLDFGDLYFEIGRRLEVANEIRQDLKLLKEENQNDNQKKLTDQRQRILSSRIELDLKHYRMNCQIPGIVEIEKVTQQIEGSRNTIAQCKKILDDTTNFPDNDPQRQIESLSRARKIQAQIEIDMEEEEIEIRQMIFERHFKLLQDKHVRIDAEQFTRMESEYKRTLRSRLDTNIKKEFREFMSQVHLCLKLINKCPDKGILEDEVKEEIEDMMPQINFDQVFLDRLAQLYHQAKHSSGGVLEHVEAAEEGEFEMSQSINESSNNVAAKSGAISASEDSSDSSSDSNSQSSSGSSSSSSSGESDSSDDEKSVQSDNSSSSGEQSNSATPANQKKSEDKQKNSKKVHKQVKEEMDKQMHLNSEEVQESKDNSSNQKFAKVLKDASDDSNDEQKAIANQPAKQGNKNKMIDDDAQYVGQKRSSEQAGLTDIQKDLQSKKQKISHNSSEDKQSNSEPLSSEDIANEEESKSRKGKDVPKQEQRKQDKIEINNQLGSESDKPNQSEEKRRRQQKKENREARIAEKTFRREMQRQMELKERRRVEPIDDEAYNFNEDVELQSRLRATQDRIRNKSSTQIYEMLAKFDKRYFPLKSQHIEDISTVRLNSQKSDLEDDKQEDVAYKLNLKAVMQQLETLVFDRNQHVNNQYQNKVNDILQNLMLLQSPKYRDLADFFFKSFNINKFYATCPSFSEFLEKIRLQRQERRKRQLAIRSSNMNASEISGLKKPLQSFQRQQQHASSRVAGVSDQPLENKMSIKGHFSQSNYLTLDQSKLPNATTKGIKDSSSNNPEQVPINVGDATANDRASQKRFEADSQNEQNNVDKNRILSSAMDVGEASISLLGQKLINHSPEEQKGKVIATNTRHDSLASFDSDNNQAKFSDDEPPDVVFGYEELDPYKLPDPSLQRPRKSASNLRRDRSGPSSKIIPPCIIQIYPSFKYNPYSIVLATKAPKFGSSAILPVGVALPPSLGTSKKQDQILYNPINSAASDGQNGSSSIKIRNIAEPGSLLKVWSGILDISGGSSAHIASTKDLQMIDCQFFSVGDIRHYQALPEFPNKLVLKGKSKIGEVTTHFKKLRHEMLGPKQSSSNTLLKGWVTRKNLSSQENSDRYTMNFEALESAHRCSVFTLFEGVSVYLIPITSTTKDFCRQMGIYPLKGTKDGNNPEEATVLEETHYYAFLSQVRQSFTKRTSFQNPEILCQAHEMPKRNFPPQQQQQQQTQQQQQPLQQRQTLKNEPQQQSSHSNIESMTFKSSFGAPPSTDPRFSHEKYQATVTEPQKEQPPEINLIKAAPSYAIKTEYGVGGTSFTSGTNKEFDAPMNDAIDVDEDEARIDALIEKFRAQEHPRVDEIQRELHPLLNGNKTGRKEEKLIAFLKEIIAKVKNQQQQQQQQFVIEAPTFRLLGSQEQQQQHQQDAMMQQNYTQPLQPHHYSPQPPNSSSIREYSPMVASQQPRHMFEMGGQHHNGGYMQPLGGGGHSDQHQMSPFGGPNDSMMQQQRFDSQMTHNQFGMPPSRPSHYHQMMQGSRVQHHGPQGMQPQNHMPGPQHGLDSNNSMGGNPLMQHNLGAPSFMRMPQSNYMPQEMHSQHHMGGMTHGQGPLGGHAQHQFNPDGPPFSHLNDSLVGGSPRMLLLNSSDQVRPEETDLNFIDSHRRSEAQQRGIRQQQLQRPLLGHNQDGSPFHEKPHPHQQQPRHPSGEEGYHHHHHHM